AVSSVVVTPAAASVAAGETARLTAAARDGRGNALPGRAVTWQSGNTAVASVSKDGVVTARAVGTAAVTALCEGQRGTAEVTVTPVAVAEVRLAPAELRLPVGDTAQRRATVKDAHDHVLSGRLVAWKSSDATVAAVSGGGLVTAVAPGAVKISATSEARSATATVLVTAAQVAETAAARAVAAAPGAARLGRRPVLRASTMGVAAAVVMVAAGVWLLGPWRTRDGQPPAPEPRVATTPAPIAELTLTPAQAVVEAGGTLRLTATLRDTAGRTLSDRAVTWSSSDPSVASVSASGLVTAGDAGSAVITATSETRTARATVTVTAAPPPVPAPAPVAAPVASLTVGPTDGRVPAGGTLQLSATARDRGGRALPGRAVTWTSSNPRIATVSAAGLVTGVAPGSARITAAGEGRRAVATVTVTAPPLPVPAAVATVAISPGSRSLQRGETLPLAATLRDGAGATLSGRPIRWSSSDPTVATVSSEGVVTAVAAGTAVIGAASEGASGSASVTVTAPATPPVDPRADREAATAEINAVLAEFARALESRHISEVRRIYPGMTAQQEERWRSLLDERGISQLTAKVGRTSSPSINGNTAELAFVLTLSFRSRTQGQVVQDVPYRATLRRDDDVWRLSSLAAQR
ncbi:MAG: Ig-like domain-containing protein, partial [Gemmatimonadales bacterium]